MRLGQRLWGAVAEGWGWVGGGGAKLRRQDEGVGVGVGFGRAQGSHFVHTGGSMTPIRHTATLTPETPLPCPSHYACVPHL